MYLEFDNLNNPTGKWSHAYDIQIGTCASRVKINTKSYPSMDKVEKNKLWEETKALFHITDDADGQREKRFHSAVATHFRIYKARLVADYIQPLIDEVKQQEQTTAAEELINLMDESILDHGEDTAQPTCLKI